MKILNKLFGKSDVKISASEIALSKTVLLSDIGPIEKGEINGVRYEKYEDGRLVMEVRLNLGLTKNGNGDFNSPYRTDFKQMIFPIQLKDLNNLKIDMSGYTFSTNPATRYVSITFSELTTSKLSDIQGSVLGNQNTLNDILASIRIEGRWK